MSLAEPGYGLPKFFGRVAAMNEPAPPTPEALQRLGELVEARRKELGYRQDNMPHGPSSTTMSAIENGESVTDLSYRRLEQSLRWATRDVKKVFAGGDPTPASEGGDPVPAPELQKLPADMTLALRVEELWRQLVELADHPGGDPQRQQIANDALVSFADFLIEMLLTLNAGAAAKSLIQEMTSRAFQILHLDKETDHDVETATKSDAQAQTVKDEEGKLADEAELARAMAAGGATSGARIVPATEHGAVVGDDDAQDPEEVSS